jgi:Amt family ammonium transporter
MLWFGWFGFNAGSALSANALATNAFITTHFAAAAGLIMWTTIDWYKRGKPSAVGAVSGAVSGLVSITPGAGFVSPLSAVLIGLAGGAACYLMVCEVKKFFGYDDTLDVFGIHGFGGAIGAVLTAVFASSAINPAFADGTGGRLPLGLLEGNYAQIWNQLAAVGVTIILAAIGTLLILKLVDSVIGLRVTKDDEIDGLDSSQHGETAYDFGETLPQLREAA